MFIASMLAVAAVRADESPLAEKKQEKRGIYGYGNGYGGGAYDTLGLGYNSGYNRNGESYKKKINERV